MDCVHEEVVVIPANSQKTEDGKIIFSDIEHGTMFCKSCEQDLAVEDLQFYDPRCVYIGAPVE